MSSWSLSMRWWLGLAFAAVAAATAIAVAQGLVQRSEAAFREDAESRTVAHSVAASAALRRALVRGNLDDAVATVSARRRLAVFVVDRTGAPITPERVSQTEFRAVPGVEPAVAAALAGRRYVRSYDQGRVTVVALPMPWDSAGALVAYSLQPGYGSTMTMISDQIAPVVTWAVLLGGAAGFAIAFLTSRRLGRIATAARAIEAGDFGRPLPVGLNDRDRDARAGLRRDAAAPAGVVPADPGRARAPTANARASRPGSRLGRLRPRRRGHERRRRAAARPARGRCCPAGSVA